MSRSGGVERAVGRLLRDGIDPPGGDARLLRRFLADRDPSAFEAIVDRHGPPVLAVCRRYLRDPADVEDAFQATFLVLVRKGGGLRDADALSSWLYGVAYRVAIRARSDALKRRAREGEREGLESVPAEPSRPVDDALEVLDAELSRLPEKYRAPLVLCHLRGRTHDQAAAELGWPVGTVRSRMAKARSLLRDRLSRRGVDAPACLAMLRAEVAAIPSVPSSLVAATASGAVRFAGFPAGLMWLGASPSSSPWPAARLAIGVLATMTTTPWKALGISLACAGLTAAALAAATIEAPGGPQDPPAPAPPPEAKKAAPGDVESRLAEVERKLDRLIDLMESLTANPADPAPEPPKPPAPPAVEARTFREIEAQLLNLERKYRIVDELVRTARAPAIDREDIVAPARVLVARLREMEDKARGVLDQYATAMGLEPGGLDDPVKALAVARDRLKDSDKRLERAREAFEKASEDGGSNSPAAREAWQDQLRADHEHQLVSAFLSRGRSFPGQEGPSRTPGPSDPAAISPMIQPTYSKLAEARRLIAWAKEHFPDVELTVDDPAIGPPTQGGEAEE